ncbi:MAG: peptide chain release factor N(5)-glutamine methyltransferase [Vicinamibacterales bacterium]
MSTIFEHVAAARQALREAGIGAVEAELSARVLAKHALGWDAARYFVSANQPESSTFAEHYDSLVARRAAREPVAYITGQQEFWGLSLDVSPAVLIPRPETELIVEAALERFADRTQPLAVADACTGSGCLAVALAAERPHATVVATDISQVALDVARRNSERHRLDGRIRFIRTNVLDGVDGTFDLIVGNPPYVRTVDRPALQPEVRDFEPPVALFGGETGMDIVATLVGQAISRLRHQGYLMFEFGFGQEVAVEELIEKTEGLTLIGLRHDLQGIARTAIARRT